MSKNKILILLLGLIPMNLLAQAQSQSNADMTELPEEIVISGNLSPYHIREQIYNAEEEMYAIFNDLNDEKRFKITCNTYEPINTRITKRHCLPEFYRNATRTDGQAYLAEFRSYLTSEENPGELPPGSASRGSGLPTHALISSQQIELQSKMQELATTNPEFLNALIKYVELKEQYEHSLD